MNTSKKNNRNGYITDEILKDYRNILFKTIKQVKQLFYVKQL